MRKNQVSICVERFGDQVPEGYTGDCMNITVYADSDNFYAALGEAYTKVMNVMGEYESAASCCYVQKRDASQKDLFLEKGNMLIGGYVPSYPEHYRKYEQAMNRRLLGYIENFEKISEVIRNSEQKNVRQNLIEKLGYSDREAEEILRMNLSMMTKEYEEDLKLRFSSSEKML